ncbi:MAG: hypothetical protein NT070_12015 [Cyanobacteria bacterium]|nr:hypothetical protein [Cyanobacteriota bacterium]
MLHSFLRDTVLNNRAIFRVLSHSIRGGDPSYDTVFDNLDHHGLPLS